MNSNSNEIEPKRPEVDQNTCLHCEHSEGYTHAIHVQGGYHKDSYCCRCGKKFCESIPIAPPSGHGPLLKQAFGLLFLSLSLFGTGCASMFPPTRIDFYKNNIQLYHIEAFGKLSGINDFGSYTYFGKGGRIYSGTCNGCTFIETEHK